MVKSKKSSKKRLKVTEIGDCIGIKGNTFPYRDRIRKHEAQPEWNKDFSCWVFPEGSIRKKKVRHFVRKLRKLDPEIEELRLEATLVVRPHGNRIGLTGPGTYKLKDVIEADSREPKWDKDAKAYLYPLHAIDMIQAERLAENLPAMWLEDKAQKRSLAARKAAETRKRKKEEQKV
jgi:hypothetical protein